MSMPWPRWPLLLAVLLTAGPSLAGEKLTPLSSGALMQLRAKEPSRVTESLANLKSQSQALGLSSMDDFRLAGAHTDRFGQTHGHFVQLHRGVPVWGAMAITHLDASGLPLPVTAEGLRKNIRLGTEPTVDASDAIALATLELSPRGPFGSSPTAELVIYPMTQITNHAPNKPTGMLNAVDFVEEVVGYKLAWHVHTELDNAEDGIKHTDLLLDAQSGEVLKKWNSLQTAAAVGTGKSQYSGTVQLNVWQKADGTYELRDTTRALGEGIRTYDVNHADIPNGAVPTLNLYTDADNTWGDGANYIAGGSTQNDNGQTAAVEAHFGLQMVWDYYKTIHGRNGIDDLGTETYNRVHVSNLYDNAFWSDGCFCMSYGDGSYPAAGGFKSMAALDVSAHELSHGVMSQTAGLIYSGESGGLNEANSDIFGTMTEFWVKNGRTTSIGDTAGNWLMGENLSATPLRYLYKPSKDGISPDAWYPAIANVDVHYSSGPMNRAFYFLAQGAQPTTPANDYSSTYLPGGMAGVGNDKAAAIWYRAISVYMYSSSNYVGARTASLKAAADLYGASSNEYRAVQNAFAAINVGYTAGTYDDRTAPTVSASVSGTAPVISLNADASDNVGVAKVEFYVDFAPVAATTSRPFQVPFDVTNLTNGPHSLLVVAYDAAGNYGVSDLIAFMVENSFEQLFTDPGFELGGEGWVADPAGNINYPVSSGAHSGQGYVWLNGYGATSTDTLYQDVTIPASATKAALTFYLNLTTAETGTVANDTVKLQVQDTSGTVLGTLATWSNLDSNLGWVQRSFDLSAYAGQTVRVYLEGKENASLATNYKLDDFSLRVLSAADTEAPAVAARVVASGTKVGFFADVSDNGYVGAVEFLVDGTSLGTVPTSFATTVSLSSLTNGMHSLVARATDANGNVGTSAPVTFFVDGSRSQVVVNPSFEDSTAAGQAVWNISSTVSGAARFFSNSSYAHTGGKFFIFWTNLGPNKSSIRQTVTIPSAANSAIYSFWLRIYNGAFTDGLAHHTLAAKLRDSSGVEIKTLETFSNADDTNAKYIEHRYDLSAYKGQTVQLFFDVDMSAAATVAGGVTQFFLDDVTLTTTPTPDTLAPSVTASVNGSYGTIQLNATVSDNIWTSSLQFLVDGSVAATRTDVKGTYQVPYDTSALPNGTHTLQVKATDTSGNVGTATVNFEVLNSTVKDLGAPVVSGGVDGLYELSVLTAEATDDTGVTAVEFYVDGAFQGRADYPPYQLPFNPIPLSVGTHTLDVVAYDAYGHSSKATTTFDRELVTVAISSSHLGVPVGESVTFSASVTHVVDPTVIWTLTEGPTCGTLTADGAYTAPNSPATCHVTATSKVDKTSADTATVKVFTADLNGDGIVDGEDMAQVATSFGTSDGEPTYSANTDFDGSSSVDDTDVTLFVSQFGR